MRCEHKQAHRLSHLKDDSLPSSRLGTAGSLIFPQLPQVWAGGSEGSFKLVQESERNGGNSPRVQPDPVVSYKDAATSFIILSVAGHNQQHHHENINSQGSRRGSKTLRTRIAETRRSRFASAPPPVVLVKPKASNKH